MLIIIIIVIIIIIINYCASYQSLFIWKTRLNVVPSIRIRMQCKPLNRTGFADAAFTQRRNYNLVYAIK